MEHRILSCVSSAFVYTCASLHVCVRAFHGDTRFTSRGEVTQIKGEKKEKGNTGGKILAWGKVLKKYILNI